MPIIAVMTGEGQMSRSGEVTFQANVEGGVKVGEKNQDGVYTESLPTEGQVRDYRLVAYGGGKENPTFGLGFGC